MVGRIRLSMLFSNQVSEARVLPISCSTPRSQPIPSSALEVRIAGAEVGAVEVEVGRGAEGAADAAAHGGAAGRVGPGGGGTPGDFLTEGFIVFPADDGVGGEAVERRPLESGVGAVALA